MYTEGRLENEASPNHPGLPALLVFNACCALILTTGTQEL